MLMPRHKRTCLEVLWLMVVPLYRQNPATGGHGPNPVTARAPVAVA